MKMICPKKLALNLIQPLGLTTNLPGTQRIEEHFKLYHEARAAISKIQTVRNSTGHTTRGKEKVEQEVYRLKDMEDIDQPIGICEHNLNL